MTDAVLHWIESLKLHGNTLDVGALDVNGNPRHLFTEYTGLDMRPGPNVDVTADAHAIPFPDKTFQNVLCLETLEHDCAFWVTVPELARVAKPGGTVAVTASGIHFPKHDYPSDYWRFTSEALRLLLHDLARLQIISVLDLPDHAAVFAQARRRDAT